MHRNPETGETLTTFFSSGTKRLLLFFRLLVFWHEERETQFLLCWLFLHRPSVNSPAELSAQNQNLNSLTQQTRGASRRPQLDWPCPSPNLNYCFFKNHQKSFTLQSHFLSGVFIMTFVIVTSSTRECELYSMCAPARALSQIVLSQTKPKDKI